VQKAPNLRFHDMYILHKHRSVPNSEDTLIARHAILILQRGDLQCMTCPRGNETKFGLACRFRLAVFFGNNEKTMDWCELAAGIH